METDLEFVGDFNPNYITFNNNTREVMRISPNGVTVPDGVPVDEAAAIVIQALDKHIRQMVASKDAEIARLRSALEWYGNPDNWKSEWDHQFKMMVQEAACGDRGEKARAALTQEPRT